MNSVFYYVYTLSSVADPDRHDVGMTTDLDARLSTHNAGKCVHTAKYRPWQVETVIAFRTGDKAVEFEKYLKSHSGRAFAKKHF